MQRISGPTAINRRFVAEDPLASQPGTIITAEWLNSVQEELANLLEKAGVPLDAANTSQLHELLNGRQAALTAPADLRPATGDTIEGDILAACDTPVGVAIATSKNHLYLCAGGRVQGVRMQPGETASWATLYCNGAKLIRCALVSGLIRTESWDLIPGSTQVAQFTLQGSSSGSGASGTSVTTATASATLSNYTLISNVSAQLFVSSTDDSEFVDGWITSLDTLVFVRRVLATNSTGLLIDELQVVLLWFRDPDGIAALVHSETMSVGTRATFPRATFLKNGLSGARIPGGDAAQGRICVVLPKKVGATTWGATCVVFTPDIENADVSYKVTETITFLSLAEPGDAPDSWWPGLQLTPFNGGAILHQRLSSDAVRLSVGASSLSMTAGALPDSARLLGCVVRSETPVLFAELDGALTVYTWATSAPQKILSLAANQLAARVDLSELERSRLSYRPSADLADLDEFGSDSGASANVSGTASGGLALHLWGLCLASRTPLWGPWTTRTATPAIPIGTDSGRLVALCPHKTFALSETSASSAQTLTLCVSPPA